tara:strand:+ start:106 stop:492 length:387 start_codon:yes stop_codon:yes gene_type:complete
MKTAKFFNHSSHQRQLVSKYRKGKKITIGKNTYEVLDENEDEVCVLVPMDYTDGPMLLPCWMSKAPASYTEIVVTRTYTKTTTLCVGRRFRNDDELVEFYNNIIEDNLASASLNLVDDDVVTVIDHTE